MDPLKRLQEERAALIKQARDLLDRAEKENRDLSTEEQTQYDQHLADAEQRQQRIERLERQRGLESQLSQSQSQPLHQRSQPDPNIGMEERDIRQYSLVRAINAAASNDWRGAELERDASRAVAQRLGREPDGFFVPYDWMRSAPERRDLTVAAPTGGGNLVATDLLAASFIDILRNRMMVRQAGAIVLTGLVGDVAIPRQTGGATAYWVGEGLAPTESQQTVDQVALTPHTVGAWTDYSRKLMKQSSIDIEAFVRNDLATVVALAIDYAALHGNHGDDANQPDGIAATSGIGSVVGGGAGAAPDWADIINLETEVAVDNADIGRLAYMTNAKVRGKLKQTAKVATSDSVMVWGEGSTPLNGYPVWVTNQVASNLVKGGSGAVCSAIFFGNWADLIIGQWGGLDILVDPYTHSTSGTMRVVVLQDVDVAVRHPQSFAAMLDALTT